MNTIKVKNYNNKLAGTYFFISGKVPVKTRSSIINMPVLIEPQPTDNYPQPLPPFKAVLVDILKFYPDEFIPSCLTMAADETTDQQKIKVQAGVSADDILCIYYFKKTSHD